MRYKVSFAIGLAAGYVLGTKAGRQRYEQIRRQARSLKDHPTVQETAGVVQAQAFELLRLGKERASATLGQTRVGDAVSGLSAGGAGHHDGSSPGH